MTFCMEILIAANEYTLVLAFVELLCLIDLDIQLNVFVQYYQYGLSFFFKLELYKLPSSTSFDVKG